MAARTQTGYLCLADISGFTSYLAGSELEHAHEILTELLEIIVRSLTPALLLAKLEGDAVFVYGPESRFTRGEAVVELIEATYAAFRDRLEGIRRRTTCQCNACRSIPSLDLKFLTHYGDYIVQDVTGIKELVGSDVNLVHRLLKNHVTETTGWRAYALFTAASQQKTGLPAEGLYALAEAYEHLGEVQTYSLDLYPRYLAAVEARRVVLDPAEADVALVQDYTAPAPVIWDWLNDVNKRNVWCSRAGVFSALERPGGRMGVGARNHCAHGHGLSTETILDWRPFDYYTVETREGEILQLETFRLEPLPDGGTRLYYWLKMKVPMPFPVPRWLNRALVRREMLQKFQFDKLLAGIGALIERERAEAGDSAQPEAPVSHAP